MFYSNPFNQNCAVFLSENKIFNADPIDTDNDGVADRWASGDITYELLPNERQSLACNVMLGYVDAGKTDVIIVKKLHANPGNPTIPYPRYEVWQVAPDRWFTEGTRITDYNGGGCADGCRRLNYTYSTRVGSGEYGSLADARNARDDYIFEKNVFRVEDGCTDSSALNYSAGASSNPCPCNSGIPVWTQGQDQSNNPQLQTTAEQAGDCSCLMPPTDLDGNGYLVEKWKYIGTPYPDEYDPNPPYSKLTKQWKWERNTSKSVLPQPNEEETIYAIAKKGWRATGLNAPQEFIVKPTLSPNTWVKYRLITATGFEKMGCMDNTAKNYDPLAQVAFTKPDLSSAEKCGTTFEDPLRIACLEQYKLWEEYGCKYCIDDDMYATHYNQEKGECECQSGYTLKGGKCKKDTGGKGDGLDIDDSTPISFATVVGGIIGITALGLLAATAKAKQGGEE